MVIITRIIQTMIWFVIHRQWFAWFVFLAYNNPHKQLTNMDKNIAQNYTLCKIDVIFHVDVNCRDVMWLEAEWDLHANDAEEYIACFSLLFCICYLIHFSSLCNIQFASHTLHSTKNATSVVWYISWHIYSLPIEIRSYITLANNGEVVISSLSWLWI